MEPELTNRKLFGLLSVESLIALMLVLVSGSVGWQVLASDVETTKRDVVSLQTQQRAIVADLGDMKVELGKISTRQDLQSENIAELKTDVKYMRELLERRYAP